MKRLERNGVGLAYSDEGAGSPPLLFVHGWSCNARFFRPQIDHFQASHRVIAIDLRGCGDSGAPIQDYTMTGYADDLAWMCEQLGLSTPVLIGHSMGGTIGFDLVARHPNLLGALVCLDSPVCVRPGFVDAMSPYGDVFRSPDYDEAARQFCAGMFMASDDAAMRSWIIDAMVGTPHHVLTSSYDHLLGSDALLGLPPGDVPIPVLMVASHGGHNSDIDRLRTRCSRMFVGQTVGAGHFHQLEVPDQVNAMIDRFLLLTRSA